MKLVVYCLSFLRSSAHFDVIILRDTSAIHTDFEYLLKKIRVKAIVHLDQFSKTVGRGHMTVGGARPNVRPTVRPQQKLHDQSFPTVLLPNYCDERFAKQTALSNQAS